MLWLSIINLYQNCTFNCYGRVVLSEAKLNTLKGFYLMLGFTFVQLQSVRLYYFG